MFGKSVSASRPMGVPPASSAIAIAVLIAAVLLVWFEPRLIGDLYMALAGGRDVVDGKLGQPDDWSFTTDGRVWMNQNWGSGLLFYLSWQQFGESGLLLIKAALIAVIAAGLLLAAFAVGASREAAMITVAAQLLGLRPFVDLRPNLVGLAGVAVLMWLLFRSAERPRRIWWAVAWVAVWSHMHGSYVFAVGMLGLWAVCAYGLWIAGRAPRAQLRSGSSLLAAPLVVMGLAVVTSPFGMRNLMQPFTDIVGEKGRLWRSIAEWRPVFSGTPEAFGNPRDFVLMLGVVAGLGIAWVCFRTYTKRGVFSSSSLPRQLPFWFDVALFAVAVAMALSARRMIPIAFVTAGPLAALGLSWLLADRRTAIPTALLLPAVWLIGLNVERPLHQLAAEGLMPAWTRSDNPLVQTWLVDSRLVWPCRALLIAGLPAVVWGVAQLRRRTTRGGATARDQPAATFPPPGWPAAVLGCAVLAAMWPQARWLAWWYSADNPQLQRETFFERMVWHSAFPGAAAEFIRDNHISGRAFCDWRWEGYLRLYCPEVQVFIGGRARQVYDLDTYERFHQVNASPTLAPLVPLGVQLAVLSPRYTPQIVRTINQRGSGWVPIFFDGSTWIVAHDTDDEMRQLIDRAASSSLIYTDTAVAALSRAACLSSAAVDADGTEIERAVRAANLVRPVPRMYEILGEATRAGKLDEQATFAYLNSEAERLAALDDHVAGGLQTLESRRTVALLLADLCAARGDRAGAQRWSDEAHQLQRLSESVRAGQM